MKFFTGCKRLNRVFIAAVLMTSLCSFMLNGYTASIPAPASIPAATANAVLVADCDTGEVIYQRNADKTVAPASTTKIMTALLTIESVNLNKVVEVPQGAEVFKGGINLKADEKLRIIDLLHGLLISSADDAAIQLPDRKSVV